MSGCTWLQGRTDLRTSNPPLWCHGLAASSTAERKRCEQSYVSLIQPSGQRVYKRCIYDVDEGDCYMEVHPNPCIAPPPPPEPPLVPSPPPPPPPASSGLLASPTAYTRPPPPPHAHAHGTHTHSVQHNSSLLKPGATPRLAAPKLLTVDCHTVTLGWNLAGELMASITTPPTVALFYGLKGGEHSKTGGMKAWSTGLHSSRATVTGLSPNVVYAFTVSVALTAGGWSTRSAPLEVQTPPTCEAPKLPGHPDCHAGSVAEVHRLAAPLVNPLDCTSLILDLPPLPPDHCDEDEHQRIAIEQKMSGSDWLEMRKNVLSSSVTIGNLNPDRAYEFRMVLRRPSAGDRLGESTGLVVTEDASKENRLSVAPQVTAVWSGESKYKISWQGASGACRELFPARWQVQVSHASFPYDWKVLFGQVQGTSVETSAATSLCSAVAEGCVFRVKPLAIEGYDDPSEASIPEPVASPPKLGAFRLFLAVMVILAISGVVAVAGGIAAVQYRQHGRVDAEKVVRELAFLVQSKLSNLTTVAISASRNCMHSSPGALSSWAKTVSENTSRFINWAKSFRENASWLIDAWLVGLGVTRVYSRAAAENPDDDYGSQRDDHGRGGPRRWQLPALTPVREEDEGEEFWLPARDPVPGGDSASADASIAAGNAELSPSSEPTSLNSSEGVMVDVPSEQDGEEEYTRL